MDLKGFGFIVCAALLVAGLFAYSNWDQTRAAAAETRLEIAMDRQPEVIQATEDVGMTVLSKVIAGVIVGTVIAGVVMIAQYLRIRELKNGGWERFWERRKLIQPRQANQRKPSMQEILLALLLRDRNERKS